MGDVPIMVLQGLYHDCQMLETAHYISYGFLGNTSCKIDIVRKSSWYTRIIYHAYNEEETLNI